MPKTVMRRPPRHRRGRGEREGASFVPSNSHARYLPVFPYLSKEDTNV
jgi:hypothetical protein